MIGGKFMNANEIDLKKRILVETAKKLSTKHKIKYGHIDISEPKSEQEKISERQISDIWSEINQLVLMKRKLNKGWQTKL